MSGLPKYRLLFVCMGNICRSPTAHGVMQAKLDEFGLSERVSIDSAGTHAYHIGEKSDARSRQIASQRGVDMEYIRARKIAPQDFRDFDFIYAMDDDNLELITRAAPSDPHAKIDLFLGAANRLNVSERSLVPDPYYGGDAGFSDVFDLVSVGCDAILHELGLRSFKSV